MEQEIFESLPAIRIPSGWVITRLTREQFERLVRKNDAAETRTGLGLPGYVVVDAAQGWVYDADSRIVRVTGKVLQLCRSNIDAAGDRIHCIGRLSQNVVLPRVERRIRHCDVGSDLPWLTIEDTWQTLTLVSELFIKPTSTHYRAAIRCRTAGGSTRVLNLSSAVLCEEFERIRTAHQTFTGQQLRIRKASRDSGSTYEVQWLGRI